MKINVDSYLNHEWEQHCKQQEEEMEMEITWQDPEPIDKDKVVSVEMTIDELGTVIEGVMGYIAWLENTLEKEKDSNIRNISFLKSELVKCQAIYPKLDKVWWDETGAEEYL